MLITLEQLKESSWYQFMAEEAQKDAQEKVQKEMGLKAVAKILRKLAAKRFPGLQLGEEVDRIHNVDALQQLCLEVFDLPAIPGLENWASVVCLADAS